MSDDAEDNSPRGDAPLAVEDELPLVAIGAEDDDVPVATLFPLHVLITNPSLPPQEQSWEFPLVRGSLSVDIWPLGSAVGDSGRYVRYIARCPLCSEEHRAALPYKKSTNAGPNQCTLGGAGSQRPTYAAGCGRAASARTTPRMYEANHLGTMSRPSRGSRGVEGGWGVGWRVGLAGH